MVEVANRQWALVGPGAIGLYYGGLLANSGVPMGVLGRSDTSVLEQVGIQIRMLDPVTEVLNAEYTVGLDRVSEDAARLGPVDVVVIAAKTTFNTALVEDLRALVRPGETIIVSLQNGMGNAEYYAQAFPGNPVLAGLCFVCVNRTAPGVVENYLPGRVEIGSLEDRWPQETDAVVAAFQQAGIKCRRAESLAGSLWRKLCWNVPFNGLAIAAGGITTDKILADPELTRRAGVLMAEVQAAAACEGIEIDESFLQGQFDVTAKMGAYQPSSLIDYLAGRAVELDSIWGVPLRRGAGAGCAMPELACLHAELRECLGE